MKLLGSKIHTVSVLCCLGLPRSCLKTSGSGELSEGAGGRNRRVHMLKSCLECLEPLAGPQAQGPWP